MIRHPYRTMLLFAVYFLAAIPFARSDEDTTKIAAPAKASPLLIGAPLRDVSFTCRRGPCDLDKFMSETRICALLVIKSGTIRLKKFNSNPRICNDEDDMKKGIHRTDGVKKEYGIASVTKSITSTLMGHAIAKRYGKETRAEFEAFLQQPVDKFIPQLGKNVSEGGYSGVPLERVLRMRSGVRWSEYSFHGWFDKYTDNTKFNREVKDCQKKEAKCTAVSIVEFAQKYRTRGGVPRFNYSALDASINAAVAEQISGEKLTDFLQAGLWKAIGAEAKARWKADNKGTAIGACCFNLHVRDLARFGLLVLNKGRAPDGSQFIPAAWFELATEHVPNDADTVPHGYSFNKDCPLDYRHQWWLRPAPKTDFTAVGIGGQFVHIYPDEDALVVQISDWRNWEDGDHRECRSLTAHDALVAAAR